MKLHRLLALFAVSLPGCGKGSDPPPRNLLLVTLDTTRADRLGCYGGPSDTSPNLDRLAREGAIFETAFCSVPETLPSHVTLLSGLEPPAHGVRVNGTPVPGDVRTISEILSAAGFATAAVVGAGVLDPGFGLRRGFDLYDRVFLEAAGGGDAERRAEDVNAVALPWLKEIGRDRRFFLWVHYYDPHDPYEPPPPYAERFRGREYEGEIAYADACFGKLLEALHWTGRLGETLVCVAGDHGEGLGEHGEPYHSIFLYDSTVRVPLLLWSPPRIPAVRVRGVARLLDVAPTLLDALGVGISPPMAGRSLLPSLGTGNIDPTLPALFEANHPAGTYGWAPLRGIRTSEWKLVRAPRPELYHMRDDPGERRNRIDDNLEAAARLGRTLDEIERRARAAGTPDPDAQAMLSSLGYASSGLPEGAPSARDPKDHAWEVPAFYRARDLARAGRFREAVAELEPIAEKDPENPEAAFLLGQFSRASGDLGAAERFLAKALALKPGHANARTLHAIVAAERGDAAVAEARFRETLRRAPTFTKAKLNFALLLLEAGRGREAEALLRDVVRERPNSFDAWETLGRLLAGDPSRRGEAIEALGKALALRPEAKEVATLLGSMRGGGAR